MVICLSNLIQKSNLPRHKKTKHSKPLIHLTSSHNPLNKSHKNHKKLKRTMLSYNLQPTTNRNRNKITRLINSPLNYYKPIKQNRKTHKNQNKRKTFFSNSVNSANSQMKNLFRIRNLYRNLSKSKKMITFSCLVLIYQQVFKAKMQMKNALLGLINLIVLRKKNLGMHSLIKHFLISRS